MYNLCENTLFFHFGRAQVQNMDKLFNRSKQKQMEMYLFKRILWLHTHHT